MLIDPAFMPWAEGKGVKLKGVEPRILPGRGIGIVAVRDIRVSHKLSKWVLEQREDSCPPPCPYIFLAPCHKTSLTRSLVAGLIFKLYRIVLTIADMGLGKRDYTKCADKSSSHY